MEKSSMNRKRSKWLWIWIIGILTAYTLALDASGKETTPLAKYLSKIQHYQSAQTKQPIPYIVLEPNNIKTEGKKPLLIYLYGAGGSHKNYNLQRPPYDQLRQLLADRGYYILVPELGPSHWMNHQAREKLDNILEKVLTDYPIDANRIHIMGTSMGGGSSLAYTIHRPWLICSVCCHLGMTDFAQWIIDAPGYKTKIAQAYGGSPKTAPQAYLQVSAMDNIDAFARIPVFLVYGGVDKLVKPEYGKRFADALKKKIKLLIERH